MLHINFTSSMSLYIIISYLRTCVYKRCTKSTLYYKVYFSNVAVLFSITKSALTIRDRIIRTNEPVVIDCSWERTSTIEWWIWWKLDTTYWGDRESYCPYSLVSYIPFYRTNSTIDYDWPVKPIAIHTSFAMLGVFVPSLQIDDHAPCLHSWGMPTVTLFPSITAV